MLSTEIVQKIETYVYAKPRSIQEIAMHLNKNWRTADRYIEEIEKNLGTISTRVFRGGTRGALKIVFWSSVEKVSYSVVQEKIEKEIITARKKEDFSGFDIFQYVPDKFKQMNVWTKEEGDLIEFKELLLGAQKQILIFSGNLSFFNTKNKSIDVEMIFKELLKKKVVIKIVCRVDYEGMDNIEKVLSLNHTFGGSLVEIRHDVQPIRGFIVDGKVMRLKEAKEPTGKINELNKKIFIFYTLRDKTWVEWLARIFWKKFSNSIEASKRLDELKKIRLH